MLLPPSELGDRSLIDPSEAQPCCRHLVYRIDLIVGELGGQLDPKYRRHLSLFKRRPARNASSS